MGRTASCCPVDRDLSIVTCRSWQHRSVRFHTEHRFTGSPADIGAILVDPMFYLDLALADLGRPELLDQEADGDLVTVRLRYEFTGSLDPIAQRLIGSGRLAWIQEVRLSRSAGTGSLRFEAEKDPRRLHGAAEFVLTAEAAGTLRRIDGELVVAVPGIGRMAERRIVPGVLRRMDVEAEAIERRLSSGGCLSSGT